MVSLRRPNPHSKLDLQAPCEWCRLQAMQRELTLDNNIEGCAGSRSTAGETVLSNMPSGPSKYLKDSHARDSPRGSWRAPRQRKRSSCCKWPPRPSNPTQIQRGYSSNTIREVSHQPQVARTSPRAAHPKITLILTTT